MNKKDCRLPVGEAQFPDSQCRHADIPGVVSHHDRDSNDYAAHYLELFGLYHKVSLDNVLRFLPDERKKPTLDAGGGTRIWSVELAKTGYEVVLIDICQGMRLLARQTLGQLGFGGQVQIHERDICDLSSCRESW